MGGDLEGDARVNTFQIRQRSRFRCVILSESEGSRSGEPDPSLSLRMTQRDSPFFEIYWTQGSSPHFLTAFALTMTREEWSPKYTPEALLREAATRLQDRFLFGSDYPFITPQRWLKDFEAVKIEFKPEVREKLFWRNGQKLLVHTTVGQMDFAW